MKNIVLRDVVVSICMFAVLYPLLVYLIPGYIHNPYSFNYFKDFSLKNYLITLATYSVTSFAFSWGKITGKTKK